MGLTTAERTELERLARSRRDRMDHVTRAQGILMLADGATYAQVHERLGWSSRTTATWKTRFVSERLAGLRGRHRGSKPTTLTEDGGRFLRPRRHTRVPVIRKDIAVIAGLPAALQNVEDRVGERHPMRIGVLRGRRRERPSHR